MKIGTKIAFLAVAMLVIIDILAVVISAERKSEKMDEEWREFQLQHHCRIKESSFWKGDVWTCDGFDIKHQ